MTRKIVDCFIFYNEFALLEYRLKLLGPHVDYFVLVESTHTFSGKTKPLLFNEWKANIKREKKEENEEKIIHVIVEDMPYKTSPEKDLEKITWPNEFHQRNCILRGLQQIGLNPEDIILLSDVDEIVNPTIIDTFKVGDQRGLFSLEMDMFYYNLSCHLVNKWRFPKLFSWDVFLERKYNLTCMNDIRFAHWRYSLPIVQNSGWHLSYFGDSAYISNKIKNFSHQEFNREEFTQEDKINDRMARGVDLFDQSSNPIEKLDLIKSESILPPGYRESLRQFLG